MNDAERAKVKVKVQLNLHGIVNIESATVSIGCSLLFMGHYNLSLVSRKLIKT